MQGAEGSGFGAGTPGILARLGVSGPLRPAGEPLTNIDKNYDPTFTAASPVRSDGGLYSGVDPQITDRRKEFWNKADNSSLQRWKDTTKFYRDYHLGRSDRSPAIAHSAANPRTRLILDEPKFKGYEVMLDVWPDVFAYGIFLLPKT